MKKHFCCYFVVDTLIGKMNFHYISFILLDFFCNIISSFTRIFYNFNFFFSKIRNIIKCNTRNENHLNFFSNSQKEIKWNKIVKYKNPFVLSGKWTDSRKLENDQNHFRFFIFLLFNSHFQFFFARNFCFLDVISFLCNFKEGWLASLSMLYL